MSLEVRRLPLSLPVVSGESFASYLLRLAARLDASLSTTFLATGIARASRSDRIAPDGYGVTLPPQPLARFAYASWLHEDDVKQLLLSHYDGIALDLRGREATGLGLRGVATRHWVYLRGSLFCPLCLRDHGGAWKLSWKLPWSYACSDHKVLLVDRCPRCSLFPESGHNLRPPFLSLIPIPGQCTNPYRETDNAAASAEPCQHQLAHVNPVSLATVPQLLDAQRTLDSVLAGATAAALGRSVLPLRYFEALRAIASFLLAFGDPTTIPTPAGATDQALHTWIEQREQRRTQPPEEGRPLRGHFSVPRSTALLAAIVPAAVQHLAASSHAEFINGLAPVFAKALAEGTLATTQYFQHAPWLLDGRP